MTIQAVYENGVFRPVEPVNLPEGSQVTVVTESIEGAGVVSPTEQLRTMRAALASFPADPVQWQRQQRDQDWS